MFPLKDKNDYLLIQMSMQNTMQQQYKFTSQSSNMKAQTKQTHKSKKEKKTTNDLSRNSHPAVADAKHLLITISCKTAQSQNQRHQPVI